MSFGTKKNFKLSNTVQKPPPSALLAEIHHISEMSLHSPPDTKMYSLPPQPDLAASVTNPAGSGADGSEDPRSRSVIGRRGAKLYGGEWVCASETRG